MGLLRDAITSAMGPGDVKNGLSGPQMPFANGRKQQNLSPNNMQYQHPVSPRPVSPQSPDMRPQHGQATNRPSSGNSSYSRPQSSYDPRYQEPQDNDYRPSVNYPFNRPQSGYNLRYQGAPDNKYSPLISVNDFEDRYDILNGTSSVDPPPYGAAEEGRISVPNTSYQYAESHDSMVTTRRYPQQRRSSYNTFRPIVLPKVAYGDGQPFLRGYSYELEQYGIAKSAFSSIVDAVNVAIIPNPEMQIFQKGANIAGWFLPGAASLGLMGGQIAAGIGGAYFHSAGVNKVLANANLNLFLPQGLEICIGSSQNIDNELGVQPSQFQPQFNAVPADKLRAYGDLLAPLDKVLPTMQNQGRNDPIAMYGKGLANRTNQKKAQNAQKDWNRGRTDKMTKLEGGAKWLIVRQASEQAINAWQKVLQQSTAELANAQAQQPIPA